MIIKTSEVQIFTFTGHPADMSHYLIERLESHGDRVIDIVSTTESMTTKDKEDSMTSEPILHYTMIYRLT